MSDYQTACAIDDRKLIFVKERLKKNKGSLLLVSSALGDA